MVSVRESQSNLCSTASKAALLMVGAAQLLNERACAGVGAGVGAGEVARWGRGRLLAPSLATLHRYDHGGSYAVHHDARRLGAGWGHARAITCLLYAGASRDDWVPADGGVLRVHGAGPDGAAVVEVPPRSGTAVLFLSHLLHEVTPVGPRRPRLALALWLSAAERAPEAARELAAAEAPKVWWSAAIALGGEEGSVARDAAAAGALAIASAAAAQRALQQADYSAAGTTAPRELNLPG